MSDIKDCFTSRWADGWIMEADFSQLEVYALAFLSQCPQLIQDLTAGLDIHGINAELLFGRGYTDKERRLAKTLSFQLQYGAGPMSMAKTNDIPITTARDFINNYYHRYPEILTWQDHIMQEVKKNRQPTGTRTKNGFPRGMSKIGSVSGRQYTFWEYDNTFAGGFGGKLPDTEFSLPQMKNYPVQGFATGDIVPLVLGKLYYVLKNDDELRDNALLINTIHDSIMLDVRDAHKIKAAKTVKRVMESAPQLLKGSLGIDFNLKLKADVKIGRSWGEMKELNLDTY